MPLLAQPMSPSPASGDLAVRKAAQQLQMIMQTVRRRRRLSSAESEPRGSARNNNNNSDDDHDDSASSDSSMESDQENDNRINTLLDSSSDDEEDEDYSVRKASAALTKNAGERKRATMPPLESSLDTLESLDWTDGGFMASDDITVASMDDSFQDHDWEGATASSPVDDGVIDRVTKKALDWMQQDVESQARSNRSMQQQLHGALVLIHSVVSSVVSLETPEDVQETVADARSLSPEKLTPLANWWKEALEDWHVRTQSEHQSMAQSFTQCREEGDARLQALVSLHEQEREALQTRIVQLQEALSQQQLDSAGQTSRLVLLLQDTNHATCDALDGHQRAVNRLMMRIEDAESELFRCRQHEKRASCSAWVQQEEDPIAEERDAQLMDLLAKTKTAELTALRWQMAYDEQAALTLQAQECLNMLEQEWSQLQADHMQMKRNLVNAISFDQLRSYQQKLVLLQGQVEDTKAQVECDHEQFLYEQTKWTNEKRQLGREVEEVHSVSMKVLKVLLLREKLLKRQEKQFVARQELLQRQQQDMATDRCALQSILQNVLKESAVVLLVVQQIAVCKQDPSAAAASHRLPVKPIQLMKLIKRLKRIEEALGGSSGSEERQPLLTKDTQ